VFSVTRKSSRRDDMTILAVRVGSSPVTRDVTESFVRRMHVMVIAFVRTKMHPDADRAAYDALNERMLKLVQTMSGFIAAHGYASSEGEEIGVIRFDSVDALRAWREHPEHLQAQRRGKSEFYASYMIEICEVVRAYDFTRASPAATTT